MANRLFQAFIDTAKTIAGYPITVANAVFMRDGSTLDEFSENIPHREDDEDTNIEVPNIDADMLNGHPADYYSKQSDLSALNNSVTQVNNKIGNTDISKWGNSLTGAIKSACDKSDANETAISEVNSKLGNTDISAIGDGTVTGGLNALNSNLEKFVIISESIELENNISSFMLIKSGFSKPPKTMYVLLDAFEPSKSGAYVKLYLNNQGDLYTTKESIISGTWYINGAYISV